MNSKFQSSMIASHTFDLGNKHVRFTYDGTAATTLFDSGGLTAPVLENWKVRDNKLFLWAFDEKDARIYEFYGRDEGYLRMMHKGEIEIWRVID